jgi:succinate--hydroxymethylglutarate CoA-transferase
VKFENHSLHEQQFKILAERILRDPSLADDPRFATNDARVKNRIELVRMITDVLMQNDREYWLEQFTGLGCV